jgi:hypothetical protein
MNERLEVKVTKDGVPIGVMWIDKDALPTLPNYLFALGFLAPDLTGFGYELKELLLIPDDRHRSWEATLREMETAIAKEFKG